MKTRATVQFFGVGITGFVIGLILLGSALRPDHAGGMHLKLPLVALLGFICVFVGASCLLGSVAFGVSSLLERIARKKDVTIRR